MTVHEFAHNYIAYRMGDPTPAREGRLTLNPMVHINPMGFLMGVLIGFGFLGSAPISPYRMRNPRWGFMWAVAAGPISNLLLAVVIALLLRLFLNPFQLVMAVSGGSSGIGDTLILIAFQVIFLNVLLALFNVIPLFPLDGWHIALALLPPDLASWWQRNQQTSYYIFWGLILLSFVTPQFNILGIIIFQPTLSIIRFLMGF
jgi:Zn-dependent protease